MSSADGTRASRGAARGGGDHTKGVPAARMLWSGDSGAAHRRGVAL